MSLDTLRARRDACMEKYLEAHEAYVAALNTELGTEPLTAKPKKAKKRGWPKGKKRGPKASASAPTRSGTGRRAKTLSAAVGGSMGNSPEAA